MEKSSDSYEEKAEETKDSPGEGSGMDMEDADPQTERADK